MRLTDFIQQKRQKIIKEWVKFAASLKPWSTGVSEEGLEDHAKELLDAVVSDMKERQSELERSAKSKGESEVGGLTRVGHKHASERLNSGFDIGQLVSEYRALRASVLRLWEGDQGDKQGEVTRFNEAIDETLAESVARYSEMVDGTREQFLGVLSHDLRNPLSAIILGAGQLARSESVGDKDARVAMRILSSGQRMNRMVSDLLDLTRTRLGAGIPVTPKTMDLMPVCQQVISELETIHPESKLRFETNGSLQGEWDSDRLTQVISNLVANAIQYGGDSGTVNLVAQTQGDDLVLKVHNGGPPIPENMLKKIFDPMVRSEHPQTRNTNSGLGLGLYIAREIVTAHGGTIDVSSTEKNGTTFTVLIPRHPAPKQNHTRPNTTP